MIPDDFLGHDEHYLLEDHDGAPYPEHVQEVVRCLAAEVERSRTEVTMLHEVLEDIAEQALRGLEEYESGLRERCRRIRSMATGVR